jgi:hypothetical protein
MSDSQSPPGIQVIKELGFLVLEIVPVNTAHPPWQRAYVDRGVRDYRIDTYALLARVTPLPPYDLRLNGGFPNQCLAASFDPSETPRTTILNSVFCSIAPQTPSW